MRAYTQRGFLFVVGVPHTDEDLEVLQHAANVLIATHGIGQSQVQIDSSGGLRRKKRTYELRAMIGHVHPGESSQEFILSSVKKELGLKDDSTGHAS